MSRALTIASVSPTLLCKIEFSDYDLIRKRSHVQSSAEQESMPSIKAQKAHRSHRQPRFPLPSACVYRPLSAAQGAAAHRAWDSNLMSLLCNQLLLFEAEHPWCLMYFEWTFSWFSGLFVCFLMKCPAVETLQKHGYFSPAVQKPASKDRLYHNSSSLWHFYVSKRTLCAHNFRLLRHFHTHGTCPV